MLDIGIIVDGKYRILRKLGEGGMAAVYEAENTRLGNRFALKIMDRSLCATSTGIERFLREATTLAKLNHPNIVRVHDVTTHDDVPILVMDLLEGQSLDVLIEEQIPLSGAEIIQIAREMLDALHYAHQQGFVHRDVKPGNIFRRLNDRAATTYCLMDFGIARDAQDSSLTVTGQLVGTRRYASPEQIQSPKSLDGRSDLYSLGVTLWELIMRQRPFQNADTDFGIMKQIIESPYLAIPPAVATNFDPQLISLIENLTRNDRNQRFGNADEALQFLSGNKGPLDDSRMSGFTSSPSPAIAHPIQVASPSPNINALNTQEQLERGVALINGYTETGQIIDQDLYTGLKLLRAAADAQDADAQYLIGKCLVTGTTWNELNAPKDVRTGRKYIRAAAGNGHLDAQYTIGISYIYGIHGRTQDIHRGRHWLTLAAEKEHVEAQYSLSRSLFLGPSQHDSLFQNFFNTEEISIDIPAGEHWLRRAANHGHTEAQHTLGRNLITGFDITAKNPSEGINWLRAAIDNGFYDPECFFEIQLLNMHTEVNIDEGVARLRNLSQNGNRTASYYLGSTLLWNKTPDGKQLPEKYHDVTEGKSLLLLAAQKGDTRAKEQLRRYANRYNGLIFFAVITVIALLLWFSNI